MNLEQAILELAEAVKRNGSNAAVAELIRQRDSWQQDSANNKNRAEMYQRWYRESQTRNEKLSRVISALRGTVTRMKRKQQGGAA